MKKISFTRTLLILGIVATCSFAGGLPVAFAQTGSATTESTTTIGGTSPFTTTPPVGSTPIPTPPASGGSTGYGTGPSSSSSLQISSYCATSKSTLLASGSKVGDVVKFFTCFIEDSIIPLLFMLALAVFVWGMVKFIASGASSEKEEGQQFMLWGVIALTVMFSVWGLVSILQKTFGVQNVVPQLPTNIK